jgi:hypothetical protein
MVSCPRCGANIDPSALACPYCQTQTYYGKQQAERQAAYQYHAAQTEQAKVATERQLRQQARSSKARHAMYWSLAGTLTCCFPAALVGLVMGLNVKGAAKKEGSLAPGSATVAVVLGCLSTALFCAAIVAAILDTRATNARIATLKTQIEASSSRDTLDQTLACALAEAELLQDGFAGKGGTSIEGFQCDGKLEQNADRATLHDVRFRTSSSERHSVAACLVRGARWSIKELRADGSCALNAASSAAPASSP